MDKEYALKEYEYTKDEFDKFMDCSSKDPNYEKLRQDVLRKRKEFKKIYEYKEPIHTILKYKLIND